MGYYENAQKRRKKRNLSQRKFFFVVLLCTAIAFTGVKVVGLICDVYKTDSAIETQVADQSVSKSKDITKKEGPKQKEIEKKTEQTKPIQPLTGDIQETPGPHDYSVLIAKGEHKLYLLDKGQKVAVWGCAIGKGGAGQKIKNGDNMTPHGNFFIEEIIDASTWSHDFKDGKGVIERAYGPWFLSLDTNNVSHGKWDGIGIHGTHDPNSIGTNASEGCIRLNNANLLKLRKYVKVGTKVVVEE